MDSTFTMLYSLAIYFIICTIIYVLITSNFRFRKSARLPPGPYPFPIIGNILQLGLNPHQSLAKLSKTYGPLMLLKLGSRTAIVVSSPALAKEVLQKHDQILSSRTVPNAAQIFDHPKMSIVWLPPSTRWRYLRKICKEQLFARQKLNVSQGLRREKLQQLYDYFYKCTVARKSLNIGEVAFTTTLNLISSTFFSVDFVNYDDSNSSQEFKEIVHGMLKNVGTPNPADYFPYLKVLDPKGIRRSTKHCFIKLCRIFEDIIDERLLVRDSSESRKDDLLEVLLDHSMKNKSEFSRNDIKGLLMDLFVAGTDTTASIVEWTIAELIRNPEKLKKARAELKSVIGKKQKIPQESDISRLPYLQAVIKESFRLHPPAPFLVPHKAEADVEINGYTVPKNAQLLVNIWATGRDSNVWPDPEMFVPERFLQSEMDVRGQHFELIPFGSGRRICPGLPLAYLMVHLMVAISIHNFELKLVDGMIRVEDMDMDEVFGLTLQKALPLKVIPVELV
ncbi:hypothetical protein ACH5RR_000280 [Cinchona calisaya]|uniref:Cytochrome P450 n=1 Tax=Cinchona calisaya TaxID=153742 RepID=A0ABD3B147_9GENT